MYQFIFNASSGSNFFLEKQILKIFKTNTNMKNFVFLWNYEILILTVLRMNYSKTTLN